MLTSSDLSSAQLEILVGIVSLWLIIFSLYPSFNDIVKASLAPRLHATRNETRSKHMHRYSYSNLNK